jgi:glutaredoxin 3
MSHVRIYTRQGCAYSAAARRLLQEKGIDFEEIDVTAHPERREEMVELTGGRSTLPQVFFGATHVGGWTELAEYDRMRGIRTLARDAEGDAASP